MKSVADEVIFVEVFLDVVVDFGSRDLAFEPVFDVVSRVGGNIVGNFGQLQILDQFAFVKFFKFSRGFLTWMAIRSVYLIAKAFDGTFDGRFARLLRVEGNS